MTTQPGVGLSTVPVPLAAPARQNDAMRAELQAAIDAVLDSGMLIMGPAHDAFEAAFAVYCGVGHAVGVANGTDALELALRAVGVQAGSSVVTVANAGGYTSTAAVAIGARPRYVDIDPVTLQLDARALPALLEERPAAVVVTHLYGQMADVGAITALCAAAGVPLVEDCAQSHGALLHGHRAGSFGTAATFSFYPTKNLGALGDGGAVVTSDGVVADRVRSLRQYGWSSRYRATAAHGRNSRLDELQAAVLLRKLGRLDEWNGRRRQVLARYRAAIGPAARLIGSAGEDNIGHLAVLWCERDREALAADLAARNVATAVHYPVADHQQEAIAALGFAGSSLPVTELAVQRVLTLPCFAELSEAEVDTVCAALREVTAG